MCELNKYTSILKGNLLQKDIFLLSVLEEYLNFTCKILITNFPDLNKMT